ncbi:hypothetical protein POM88_035337 [Heracleum sosnowskyi]|uniref:Plastocyanin-like domain-containing protein n=1 Tax=Heracleum sosnowskyi TaxID=360622 RepID=A0AAD8HL26_9APIA|nr:hypothetical protein POM88_035337 [Heracleum sosnowskyi]
MEFLTPIVKFSQRQTGLMFSKLRTRSEPFPIFHPRDSTRLVADIPSTGFHKAGGGYGPIRVNNRIVIDVPFSTPEAQFDLLIGDWYQRSFKDIQSELNNPYMAYDTPPDKILINGKGPYGDPLMKSHESFNVTKGKTYLLRISNVGLV